jgi:putative transposase
LTVPGDVGHEARPVVEAHARTGPPLGGEAFVAGLEAATGRRLKRRKPGPQPKGEAS